MLPYLALLMTGLLLCCGIAVDAGLMQMHKLQMQSAADAAALGAELDLERGTYDSSKGTYTFSAAGQNDAALNGFTDGANNTTVSVGIGPVSGNFAGYTDAIQARISQKQTGFFSRLLSWAPTLNASAVTVMPPCVLLTGSKSLTTYQYAETSNSWVGGTCPVYVNSSVKADSSSTVALLAENTTGTAAGSSWNPGSAWFAPRFGAQTLPDPLSMVAQPTAGSCATNNYSATNVSSNQNAPPATYCGNSSYSCTNSNVVITFNPGIYVFAGSLSIHTCTVSGSGATFFFTKNASTGNYGKLALSNVTMNLTAPVNSSNGAIPGVLFMTDRGWVPNAAQDFVLDSCTFRGDGIWYLTNAGLAVKGGTIYATNYQGIFADNLLVTNSGNLLVAANYSTVTGGNPMRPIGTLVE